MVLDGNKFEIYPTIKRIHVATLRRLAHGHLGANTYVRTGEKRETSFNGGVCVFGYYYYYYSRWWADIAVGGARMVLARLHVTRFRSG